jgi:hypothetical protein
MDGPIARQNVDQIPALDSEPRQPSSISSMASDIGSRRRPDTQNQPDERGDKTASKLHLNLATIDRVDRLARRGVEEAAPTVWADFSAH